MFDPENLPPVSCLKQAPLNKNRADKFILTLNIPLLLRKKLIDLYKDRSIFDKIQVNLLDAPLPTISVPSQQVPQYGQVYNVSTHCRPKYDDLSINFFIDTQFINYWIFACWLDLLNGTDTSLGNLTSDTSTIFVLSCLDEYNSKIVDIEYTDVCIVSLGGLAFDYANPAQLKGNAKFVFNKMYFKYPQT